MDDAKVREWADCIAAAARNPISPVGIQPLLAAFAKEVREDCELEIRAACSMCDGTGVVTTTGSAHAGDCDGSCRNCPVPVEEQEQCEYCGRPIDAIRAREKGGE